jgi:hypothetical protein
MIVRIRRSGGTTPIAKVDCELLRPQFIRFRGGHALDSVIRPMTVVGCHRLHISGLR